MLLKVFAPLCLFFSINVWAGATVYKVDVGQSVINWEGSKKVGDDKHFGDLKIKSGQVTYIDGKPVSGEFVIDMTTINSTDLKDPKYKAKLDGHLKAADFFDVANHKKSTYKFTSAKEVQPGTYELAGEVTVRGVTKPKTIKAKMKATPEGLLRADTKVEIDRTKYGIMYKADTGKKDWFFVRWFKKGTDKIINNNMKISVNLVAQAPKAEAK